MALFKIFRRKHYSGEKNCSRDKGHSSKLTADDIWDSSRVHLPSLRLIIFRESEWKERRLLYDSNLLSTTAANSAKKSPAKANSSPPISGKDPSPPNKSMPFSLDEEESANSNGSVSDTKSIAEMMFGSVGMYSKGNVIKLHELRNPSRIMLTHVFQVLPINRRRAPQPVIRENIAYDKSTLLVDNCQCNESDSDSQYSTINSMDSFLVIANQRRRSGNVRIPRSCSSQEQSKIISRSKTAHFSSSPENELSQESNQDKSATGTPSNPVPITASWKSLQLSYMISSFENINQRRSSQATGGGTSDEDDINANASMMSGKRTQIGVAVVFSSDHSSCSPPDEDSFELFRRFLFSHAFVAESEISYLTEQVAKSCYAKKQDFFLSITQAWIELCTSLRILYETPRLSFPVWSSLTYCSDERLPSRLKNATSPSDFASLYRTPDSDPSSRVEATPSARLDQSDESMFVSTLCELTAMLDTKETNFFLSTALTTFLTLHSGWVSSVAPPSLSATLPSTSTGQVNSTFKDIKKTSYRETIRSNVNVFVSQLLDLWSVFNSDHHSLRSFFVGSDNDVLAKLAFVFSYFLRCNSLSKKLGGENGLSIDFSSSNNDDNDNPADLGGGRIFDIRNDTNYGGNYGPACDLADYLYDRMACVSEENLAQAGASSAQNSMDVDKTAFDHDIDGLSNDRFFQNPSTSGASDFPGEAIGQTGEIGANVSRTVKNVFSSAKLEHLTHHRHRPSNWPFLDDPTTNEINDGDGNYSNKEHTVASPTVDLNNNRPSTRRRFDDPGFSLQAGLQRLDLSATNICPITNFADLSASCSQLNANFALSAVLVQPPVSGYSRKASLAGRSSRSGSVSTPNGLCGPLKTDQQVIRDALITTADKCDPMYVSAIDFLVADCRDWSVKVLSCDVTKSTDDTDQQRRSPRISESNCLPARCVLDMLENVRLLNWANTEPEFILVYIEDWLADIYNKGLALTSLIDDATFHSDRADKIIPLESLALVGADPSDAPLLLSVCAF